MKCDNNTQNGMPDWLVMYSNSGDIGILDALEAKQAESSATGIVDYFVPLEDGRPATGGQPSPARRLIAGGYIFIRATREDILRLRQQPPFDTALRFLHPPSSPTGCIHVPDEEMRMLRLAVGKMGGEVDYFVPTGGELTRGDSVCVFDGEFAGVKGVLESVKGHEGGRIIVALRDVLAVRTPRIPGSDIQLISLARAGETGSGSYTSRAYKKVRVLMSESERLLEEKEKRGGLSEKSRSEADRLIVRFSRLELTGKIRQMHARAICNILQALGETEGRRYSHFRNMLP